MEIGIITRDVFCKSRNNDVPHPSVVRPAHSPPTASWPGTQPRDSSPAGEGASAQPQPQPLPQLWQPTSIPCQRHQQPPRGRPVQQPTATATAPEHNLPNQVENLAHKTRPNPVRGCQPSLFVPTDHLPNTIVVLAPKLSNVAISPSLRSGSSLVK